ncbi:hypothetical protein F4804DRAFT_312893 [Jackrogersella minutella]|nr:hypothetical protein F4804DRAFT_312893 [Jackrogersella minutella]
MPMWPCDFTNCQKPAVRTLGDCVFCNRHLCSVHLQPAFHNCPQWEDVDAHIRATGEANSREVAELIEKINISAFTARASELRQGIPCSISLHHYDKAIHSVMGGMNYHAEINFDDGIKWMARIRRSNATSPPPVLRDYILQSEVATLKFLQKTSVPAPKVFDFALDHADNPVGVGYILMEKLPGKSLIWASTNQDQRTKIMNQLADIFIELRKYPFDLIGSLDHQGDCHVAALAREALTDFENSGMRTMGPFSSIKEYYESEIKLILDLILRQELYSKHAVDAYLTHRYLFDLIPLVSSSSVQSDQNFYLKHADDKGDHILVDEEFNITGIIDWEWAHTAPSSLAFNSPIGLLPVGEFYEGVNNLGHDENIFVRILEGKGHGYLADCVRNGRLQHRFSFCKGYELSMDWDGFLGLFQGLRDAVEKDSGVDWETWRAATLHRYREDDGLQILLSRLEDIV